MASRRSQSGKKSTRKRAASARGSSRGSSRDTKAKRLRRELRNQGSNINIQYWITGYAERQAQKTGKLLTPAQVRRSKDYQRWRNVVLSHDPKRAHGANSELARALVELGVRDPSFRGAVGNSPAATRRGVPRDVSRARRGLSNGAMFP